MFAMEKQIEVVSAALGSHFICGYAYVVPLGGAIRRGQNSTVRSDFMVGPILHAAWQAGMGAAVEAAKQGLKQQQEAQTKVTEACFPMGTCMHECILLYHI